MSSEGAASLNFTISRLDSRDALGNYLPSLRTLLQECVNDNPSMSSLGFIAPMNAETADEHWLALSPSISGPNPTCVLLVATIGEKIIATAQVVRIAKETHKHRGEVRKVLVRSNIRGLGLGKRMMEEIERVAREELAIEVLGLDTDARTPARGFYEKLGWTQWGRFPDYAASADGVRHECAFFYKKLR